MKIANKTTNNTGQKILIYGPPKSGKTLLAGALAQRFDLTWFDMEHGSLTLKQLPPEYQQRIELVQIPDNRKNYTAITAALYLTEGKPVKICDIHGNVGPICKDCSLAGATGSGTKGTLIDVNIEGSDPSKDIFVFDSITQLSHSAMGRAFLGNQDEGNLKPEYSHYTAQGFYLDRFLTAVQNSRANIICISHEESLEQEDGSEKLIPMAGTRNFSRNTARYFDHVVYLSVKNFKFSRLSSPVDDSKILAGSRTNVSLKGSQEITALLSLFDTPEVNKALLPPAKPAHQTAVTGQSAVKSPLLNKLRDSSKT